eukprot:12421170-Karenia_brevis.AAC.1
MGMHQVFHCAQQHAQAEVQIAGCNGTNPYIVQLAPQVSHNMAINPASAWSHSSHLVHTSPSSHVASSSLPSQSHTHSPLLPSSLMNSFQRCGITGQASKEDVDMEVDGVPTPPPPTPLAQSHLQKLQELQELQEAYQKSLAEKGEHHLQTK